MSDINWDRYPSILRVPHLADIYNRKPGGVRWGLRNRSKKLPTPCQTRPFGVRKSDCQRHFSRMSA